MLSCGSDNNPMKLSVVREMASRSISLKASEYTALKRQCIQRNTKFQDEEFPPNEKSLKIDSNRRIIWKRIPEIVKDCLMVEGIIEPMDLLESHNGDSYFLASIAALAKVPDRICHIFGDKMELDPHGIYRLVTSVNGVAQEIVIDDFVPVYADTLRPVFCRAVNRQVWMMLLEKGWAKINGSYSDIETGSPHQVFNAFSIAPSFYYSINSSMTPKQIKIIWDELMLSDRENLPTCVGSKDTVNSFNIKSNQTFTVLKAVEVSLKNGTTRKVIKLRNPWGNYEYNGPCSESDQVFWSKEVQELDRLKIRPQGQVNDGIFIIPFEIVLQYFNYLEVCHAKAGFNERSVEFSCKSNDFRHLQLECSGLTYVTAEKIYQSKKKHKEGYIRLFIAQQKKVNEQVTFQYIVSKWELSFNDCTVSFFGKKGSRYNIVVQAGENNKKTNSINGDTQVVLNKSPLMDIDVKVYSKDIPQVKSKILADPRFFEKIFLNHAFKLNQQKVILNDTDEDSWIASRLMINEGGLGYLAVSLNQSFSRIFNLNFTPYNLMAENYTILEKSFNPETSKQTNSLRVEPGSAGIVVLALNPYQSVEGKVQFPPKSLNVSEVL